jgi:hypothetical protein
MNVGTLTPLTIQNLRSTAAAISANYAGCEWTTTIKAEHTTTGKYDTDTVTIKYPIADPVLTLRANGSVNDITVNTNETVQYAWASSHATKVTLAANAAYPSATLC